MRQGLPKIFSGLDGEKIFIAGGAGFIGSNLIHFLLERSPRARVLNFDKLTYSGNLDNLRDLASDPRYTFVRGDITNKKKLFDTLRQFKPRYIINFAAESHVDRSIHVGSEAFIKTNIGGVFNFLEYIKENKIEKFLHVSTDEVYGSLDLKTKKKFTEESPFAPNIPYSATKAGGDLLCRAYYSTWKVPVVVTHCSNNFGPHQYPEKLIPFLIVRAMRGEKLPLYGDGRHVRDWIYVLDHCRALLLCLTKGRAGEVYNIGSGYELPNIEIARLILKAFGRDESRIEFVKERPGHDRRYALDTAKIKREFGWQAEISFAKAFSETVAWYRANQPWIDRVRRKTGVFNPHIDLWKAHARTLKKL